MSGSVACCLLQEHFAYLLEALLEKGRVCTWATLLDWHLHGLHGIIPIAIDFDDPVSLPGQQVARCLI
eukprot:4843086-Amphidinium_carterae.2